MKRLIEIIISRMILYSETFFRLLLGMLTHSKEYSLQENWGRNLGNSTFSIKPVKHLNYKTNKFILNMKLR